MFSKGQHESSEWIEFERKVPDQQASNPRPTVKVKIPGTKKGRGKKGSKEVVLHVPRSFLPERKRNYNAAFWTAETLDIPTSTASVKTFFGNIGQGLTAADRIGSSVFIERVVIRIYVEQSTGVTFTTADLAVVLDREPQIGVPVWTDIFQGIGGAGVAAYHVAIPNDNKRFRFQYLERATLPLAWQAAYWNGSTGIISVRPVLVTLDIPVKRMVKYDGAGPVNHEMVLMGWSDQSSNTPKATASYEIFFQDC